MNKRKPSELAIRINWSANRDSSEDRPFDESFKGLGSEMFWALGLIAFLSIIVAVAWLIR
jgi:hypothetical protein